MTEVKEIIERGDYDEHTSHVLQSWDWGEFKAATLGVKRVLRLGTWEKERLTKTYQIFFHKIPKIPHTIAYIPRGNFPTGSELAKIRNYCLLEKALFLKIDPNMGEKVPRGNFLPSDPIQPKHTIYIDLIKPEETLLAKMHEKTRYNIRLALRKGVQVLNETDDQAVETFIAILSETEKRQRFYAHSANYYRDLWRTLRPKGMVYILNAYPSDKKTAIGSIILFRFKDFIYYPYGGFLYEHRQLMAPQLLHFEAMKLGRKLGCRTYDLWGSYKKSPSPSDPWWGFYRLKSGLGGEDVDFPETVDIPLSPLYSVYNFANLIRWRLLGFRTLLER